MNKILYYTDIERDYTNILNEYLKVGYTVNTDTFSGHQGEICKIDLKKNDDEILRILLHKTRNDHNYDSLILEVRIYDISINKNMTLWNNQGKCIFQNIYYEYMNYNNHNKIYTLSESQFKKWIELHEKRVTNRSKNNNVKVISTDNKKYDIIIKYIRKTKGYKTVSKKDIKQIKSYNNKTYDVIFNDNKKYFSFSIK